MEDTDGAMCSLWMVVTSTKDINKKIEIKKEEIRILKEIIIKQTENMQELQTKCEEANVILKQMPEIQQSATERYEEALQITAGLQLKQCEINEILENTFKLYDNTLQLIGSIKQNFNSGREAGKQRQLVFDADIKEMKKLGDRIRVELNKKIKDKELLLETIEGNLGKFSCHHTIEELAKLNEKIKNLQQTEERENKEVLLIKQQFQRSKEEGDYVKDCFDKNKSEILQEKEKYGKLAWNEEFLWNDCQLKIKESDGIINTWTENNDKMNRDVLEEGNAIKSIKEEIICKALEIEQLIIQLNKMKTNLPELSILTNMLQEKQLLVNKLEEEIMQYENNLQSNEDMLTQLESNKNNLKQKVETADKELNSQTELNKELQLSVDQSNTEIEITHSRTMGNEKTLEQKQNEIINRINQIVKEDTEIVRQITSLEKDLENKKENSKKMRKEISLRKIVLEEKSNKVAQLEEEIQQAHLCLISEEQVFEIMCEQTNNDVEKLQAHCKTVKLISHEIENEKMRFEKSKESHLKECEALNKMYNNKIDAKLKELEELKKQLSVEEEKYSDESSKIHFHYYTLKNEKRFLTGEMNYLQSVINRCSGEYVIMDSYNDWITKKSTSFLNNNSEPDEEFGVQNVVVQNMPPTVALHCPQEDRKCCSSGSDSSLDLPAEEFVTTKIVTSKPIGKPLYQMPSIMDTSGVITLDSSDSEPPATINFFSIKRKSSFLEKPRGPPLKILSSMQKKEDKSKSLTKQTGHKTILDLVIDSS